MTKLRLLILTLIILFHGEESISQQQFPLRLRGVDHDSAFIAKALGIPPAFESRAACVSYINDLPSAMRNRGYMTASIDSVFFDSAYARMVIYLGSTYRWATLTTDSADAPLLDAVGWRQRQFRDRPMDFNEVREWQEKILTHLENNGHPFARVYVDAIDINGEKVTAALKIDKGPSYRVDSIRVIGNVKISNLYLQRYLDIMNGSTFSKEKLMRITSRMRELPYVEEEYPSRIIWLGTGSILEMYLRPKRSSQVNVLIGFLPNNDQLSSRKILITGEANIHLRNALGAGETIGFNWQQLQVKSPRLNLLYQHPYLFNTPIGLDFSFDMFRKDSTFLNVNLQLGAQYVLNARQAGKLFIQRFQTIVNGVNTTYILQQRRLPGEADVSSFNLGIDYEFNNTNYRRNPTRGNEFRIITSAGSKKIRKNNQVLDLKDPGDPSFNFESLYDTIKLKTYQLRARVSAAKYLPLGRQNRSTVKLGLNGGFFQSGNIFRNELFQIGGYKLLRGFDEESQYLSQFAIGTVEYRLLVGQNSFFYVLADGGWGRNNSQNINESYTYFGTGLGLAFETRMGIFNFAWAVGKRNDTELNLRQSKIHFGFVNYF